MVHPDPPGTPSELLEAARLLARGDEAAAVQACDRFLAGHPEDAEALTLRGMAVRAAAMKLLEAAFADFERAAAADPGYAKAHFQLIRLAPSLGRLDQVIRRYKGRILENKVDPRNYAYLAFALLAAGDAEHARQVAETGLAVGPTDAYLHYTYGEVLRTEGALAEAAAAWERSLQHDAGMIDALYALGEAYEELGRPADAEAAWERLKRLLLHRGAPAEQIAEVEDRLTALRRRIV